MSSLPKVIERLPILFCILLIVVMFNKRDTRIDDLQTQLDNTNIKLTEANEQIELLKAHNKELSDEVEFQAKFKQEQFEQVWESFATVRLNFLAIGLGYHLDVEDVCPELAKECSQKILGREDEEYEDQ